ADRLCLHSQRRQCRQDLCSGRLPDPRRQRFPRSRSCRTQCRGCRCCLPAQRRRHLLLLQDKGSLCRCLSRGLWYHRAPRRQREALRHPLHCPADPVWRRCAAAPVPG
ncbi:hypothetical protein BN1723_020428, partial [Verticillium longisporum]